ncbi:hypothetical protein [Pseudonocardia sp. H11422]|uniref:WYL domain-containing protein n=1 Tax=Pseudonocardia sp. H11422 TaxID=2835866 RepID=UPI001BDCB83F|nr:hypothetical protein [Pseudonocardia sp. H11422]
MDHLVEERPEGRAPDPAGAVCTRARIPAAEPARRLPDPHSREVAAPDSPTYTALAALTTQLDSAELTLLADAIDNQRDVSIVYRDKQGNRTTRDIRPRVLHGRWLDSWCHWKNGQRDFTVGNIEAVAPAG